MLPGTLHLFKMNRSLFAVSCERKNIELDCHTPANAGKVKYSFSSSADIFVALRRDAAGMGIIIHISKSDMGVWF